MTANAAPRPSGLRDRLAAIVASTFRVPVSRIIPFASFTSLGMDSLAAVELTAAIEDELGIVLPMTAVHECPTLEALCHFIEHSAGEATVERQHEQLLADATLPPDIVPSRAHGASVLTRDARDVLLTGATGFIGAYLLRALLDETTARIHCLVRPGASDGLARLRRTLTTYGLWDDPITDRVAVVAGDITRPRLGLDAREFRELASTVDVIYHAAADVNWVHGYETLRDANVGGTRELLRLACEGVPKPMHFISSISVCHSTTGPRILDERANVFDAIDGLRLGYAQSKCVAEALVREAAARGLPVTIIRPSLVSGESVHGRSNVDDLTSRFIAGCIRLHAAPDLDWRLDCVPVDEVAQSILRLARAHEGGIAIAHVTADRPRHWRECVLWMRLCGYDIDLLPYREWMDVLRATGDADQPLHALRSFFLHTIAAEHHLTLPELFEESRRSHVNAAQTRRSLDVLGRRARPLTSRLLSRYFDDFVRRGIVADAARRQPVDVTDDDDAPILPGSDARLRTALGTWLSTSSARIDRIDLASLASDESIVAELTAWRAGTRTGLFHANVSVTDDAGAHRDVRLFVKAKAADAQVIEVAEALAALASPALGETVARFRDHLGLTRCHVRELALYAHADERLRRHSPRPLLIDRDDPARRWVLVLESIDDSFVMNATDTTRWNEAAIGSALTGLAQIHAVWHGRESSLIAEPWLAPVRDASRRVEMTPLWTALSEHARERSPAWNDHRLRRIHERLVGDVGSWARALDAAPRTLIHNDFNPRNIALRRAPEGLRVCAFDWELATLGLPQRDLAELLCFVLPPDAPLATIGRWVERYRSLLASATGIETDRSTWEAGFSAAMCDVLVDRFASYAMIDRVRPQRFLSRVVRSWLNVFRWAPWE